MTDAKTKKSKAGRKPYGEDRKRVRIGCRVTPQTDKFLRTLAQRLEPDQQSIGRAIDYCVDLIRESGIDPDR